MTSHLKKTGMIAVTVTAALVSSTIVPASAQQSELTEAAQSNSMIWNGVAVEGGRVFVSRPRWIASNVGKPRIIVVDGEVALSPESKPLQRVEF